LRKKFSIGGTDVRDFTLDSPMYTSIWLWLWEGKGIDGIVIVNCSGRGVNKRFNLNEKRKGKEKKRGLTIELTARE
jgi:hypothetical protein